MNFRLHRLLTRLLCLPSWGSPAGSSRKLMSFARAEYASMLDMQLAAAATEDPERAALYLRHAADEARHARVFARRAAAIQAESGGAPSGDTQADTVGLFSTLGELEFLAFVHHGEARARAQFDVYRSWFEAQGRQRDLAVFAAVMADEERHERYTGELLLQLAGSRAAASKALRRVAARELVQRARRAGQAITAPLFWVTMVVLYLLLLPLALPLRLSGTATGWTRSR